MTHRLPRNPIAAVITPIALLLAATTFSSCNTQAAPGSPTTIAVPLTGGDFALTDNFVLFRGDQSVDFTTEKPDAVTNEPEYLGDVQLYGCATLGTIPATFCMAMDLVTEDTPVLYFDLNRNGDLTDDNGPILNAGDTAFAALVNVPFTDLIDEVAIPGQIDLWCFTNDFLWSETPRILAVSNRSQFAGTLNLGGSNFNAWVGDSGNNDADFTNDGIMIDLNADDSISADEEFPGNTPVTINGQSYIFQITWTP